MAEKNCTEAPLDVKTKQGPETDSVRLRHYKYKVRLIDLIFFKLRRRRRRRQMPGG